MKITILDWGPVKKCEFDLDKDLLVTYGDNNIGKSYSMMTLYILLKSWGKLVGDYSRMYHWWALNKEEEWEEFIKEFCSEQEKQEFDITQVVVQSVGKFFGRIVMMDMCEAYENTFGTWRHICEGSPKIIMEWQDGVSLTMDFSTTQMLLSADIVEKPIYLKKTTSSFHKSKNSKNRYDIYVYENYIQQPAELIGRKVYELERFVLEKMKTQIGEVYFLPASRSGIYTGMNSLSTVFAQMSQVRSKVKGMIEIPGLAEPIADYFIALSNIRIQRGSEFTNIANEIENEILGGDVIFDSKSKNILFYDRATRIKYKMDDVSSMVSEISPITAFIKYIVSSRVEKERVGNKSNWIKVKPIVFIEEPEAHLHPANQVKLIDILARLSKGNIQIIMSSHSNYIFNKLNNLVLEGTLSDEDYAPIIMRKECGVSQSYLMELDEYGVSDENFVDISEQLYEERQDLILQRLEKEDVNDTED